MKNALILACAASLVSTASIANPAERNIQLQGVVAKFCKLDGTLAGGPGASGFQVSGDSVTIEGFSGADGKHMGTEITLVIPNALCNAPATLTLASANNGLLNASAPVDANWDSRVTYLATAAWDGIQYELNVQEGTFVEAGDTDRGYTGDLTIVINTTPSANPLQAGTYSDTLTVTLDVTL